MTHLIKLLKKLSFYTRTILLLNISMFVIASLFFYSGWDRELTRFIHLSVVYDLAILVFIIPVYVMWLHKLIRELNSKWVGDLLYWGFFAALGLAIFGLGVHISGNQISYLHQSEMVEFYDEYLGHIFALIPAFMLTFLFMLAQAHAPVKALGKADYLIIVSMGAIHGVVGALGILEARGGGVSMIIGVVVIVYAFLLSKKNDLDRMPIVLYHLILFISIMITLGIWWTAFGEFVEPSKVAFGRF